MRTETPAVEIRVLCFPQGIALRYRYVYRVDYGSRLAPNA